MQLAVCIGVTFHHNPLVEVIVYKNLLDHRWENRSLFKLREMKQSQEQRRESGKPEGSKL